MFVVTVVVGVVIQDWYGNVLYGNVLSVLCVLYVPCVKCNLLRELMPMQLPMQLPRVQLRDCRFCLRLGGLSGDSCLVRELPYACRFACSHHYIF